MANRLPMKLRLVLVIGSATLASLSLVLAAALVYYTIRFPDPMSLRKSEAGPVVRVLARDGTVLLERGQPHPYVPLDLLPRHVIEAVVATEDRRFFDHNGLDPTGVLRAVLANLRAGRYIQGGSTLSQQLAKNLFLTSERTLGRKFEELLLAIWLEVRLSKDDILELYLNRVYFGAGAYGIEAAAHRYFDKPAKRLTLVEAAVIAGLLKAPSRFSPLASRGLARQRGRVVLKAMLAAGFIGAEAEASAQQQSVQFADPSAGRATTGLEYAVDFILERLPPLIGADNREIVVETTIDAALQRRAQAAVTETLAAEGTAAGAGQASAVIVDPDGGIRAMVGGRAWAQSQFNRAAKSRRQPGSAFKPFVYLAAIEQGATPDTTVLDMPINLGGWSPRNEGGQHKGAMTLRQALAHSVNTVAVRLQLDTGTTRVIATARKLGIKSELRSDPSLALGTSEVSLLELTGAYASLASGGLGVEPHAIVRVRSSSGQVLFKRPATRPRMIVAPDHVGMISSMLNTAMVSGTGRRAALARHVAAGKTGTSQDHRDAWFVGYTAHLTGGVWVGNDGGEPMNRVMGSGLPASIWKSMMQAAHAGLAPSTLPGMQDATRPGSSDTLVDADRDAKPIETIADLLALEGHAATSPTRARVPPAAAAVAAERRRAHPVARRGDRGDAYSARRNTPAAARHPAGPIEKDLFVRALEATPQPGRDAVAVPVPAPAVTRSPSGPRDRSLMGLGVRPSEIPDDRNGGVGPAQLPSP